MSFNYYMAGLLLAVSCSSMNTLTVSQLPPVPDAAYAKGVSAPFCGYIGETLVMAGGANFPDKPLLEGGTKKVYADIWAYDGSAWRHAGCLPDSVAYGASFQVEDALVFAGGNINGTTSDKVYKVQLVEGRAQLTPLPSLPLPMEQYGWSQCGDRLYLAGTAGVFTCKAGAFRWTKLADIPEPLVQPVAFATEKGLFLWGGFNPETLLAPSAGHFLNWETLSWETAPEIPDGGTFVGAVGVSLPDGRLAVVGGVNRAIFERALRNTPEDRIPYLSRDPEEYQFRKAVYLFDGNAWRCAGTSVNTALAGPGAAYAPDGTLLVTGGEIKPGVRSSKTFKIAL